MPRILQLIYERMNPSERWMLVGFVGLVLLGSIVSSCRSREPKGSNLLFPAKIAPKPEADGEED
jgi:hypothetical protein